MELFLILLAVLALPILIKAFSEKPEEDERKKSLRKLHDELEGDLKVNISDSHVTTKSGQKLPCQRVSISGTCMVPSDNCPCAIHFRLFDITEEETEDKLPVLCMIPELSDDNGFVAYQSDINIPYEISSFDDMTVIKFPPEALVFPKRGKREVEACVAIVLQDKPTQCIKEGVATKTFVQKGYGYLEFEERSIETNQMIARIAVSICASDGHIDRRETAIVRSFFAEQFARLEDPERIKESVNEALKEAIETYKEEGFNSDIEDLESSCEKLVEAGRPADIHATYELAVRIIAVDNKVQEAERNTLRKLAQLLEMPDDLAKDIQDKYFKVSMFSHDSDEAIIEMPSGFSVDQKIKHLNKEYQKWRSRVNHQDRRIRTEAEMRIQAITRIRKKLEREKKNV